jgi:TM2 domain-containing membrane protein YozV
VEEIKTEEIEIEAEESTAHRVVFVLLAVFLGAFGVHNFYIGKHTRAFIQIALTLLTVGTVGFVVWLFALYEAVTVTKDSEGKELR